MGFFLCFPDTVVAVNGIWILVETFMLQGGKDHSLFLDCGAGGLETREDLRKLFLCLAGGNFFSRNVPWSYIVFLTSKLMPPNRAVSFPEELGRELKLKLNHGCRASIQNNGVPGRDCSVDFSREKSP